MSEYFRIEEMHFIHIRGRILKIKPSVRNLGSVGEDGDKPITLIVDASGLTISKKGDYIEEQWIHEKKEFVKLHNAIEESVSCQIIPFSQVINGKIITINERMYE